MKTIKTISLILLILIILLSILMFFAGGFLPVFIIGFVPPFLYYSFIFILSFILVKRKNKPLEYITYLLFLLPIIWLLIDSESLFTFLFESIDLDMK